MRVAAINAIIGALLLLAYGHHIWRLERRLADKAHLRLASTEQKADDTDRETTTPIATVIDTSLWSDSSALINPVDICSGALAGRLRLLMVIPSTAQSRDRRDVLRATWVSVTNKNTSPIIRHVFLFGSRGRESDKALQEESRQYNDIVCYDFVDSYRNLTVKTLVGLNWAATYCKQAEYVYKVDDDNYVNVTNLLNILAKQRSKDKFMLGKVHWKSQASRSPTSKWYVPYWLYPYTRFPPYCDGSGYVMPIHVARDVVKASEQVRSIFLEDVYMGMCIRVLNYGLRYQESMHFPRSVAEKQEYHCLPRVTSVHRMSSRDVLNMWKECNTGLMAEDEVHHRDGGAMDLLLQKKTTGKRADGVVIGQADDAVLNEDQEEGRDT